MPNLLPKNERIARKIAGASRRLADAKPTASGVAAGRKALAEMNPSALTRRVRGGLSSDGAATRAKRAISPKEQIAAVSLALNQVVDNVSYADLSAHLQRKFTSAGLRGGPKHWRAPEGASGFYDASIPDAVKMLGEDGVREFLDGKNASHIKSVSNWRELAGTDSNILWENRVANYERGAADMSAFEQLNVRLDNGFDSFRLAAVKIVPRAVFYAIVIEASVSIVENGIYVYRGKKDVGAALQATSLNVAKSAVVGALAGGVVSGTVALGAAPVIVTAAPALGVIGGCLLVYSAANRIHAAATAPLDDPARRWRNDSSDEALLAPLNENLELLNALKAELARSVPTDGREQLKQL